LEEFFRLVNIDSVSFNERKMADYLKTTLNELGLEVYEDNAGKYYNGSSGNIYAHLKGEGDSVLFCAHMDTVQPGIGKKAVIDNNGVIKSAGDTVLGADDAAGIAEIIEALRLIKENDLKHRDIELIFPIAEEVYIKGTNVFDFSKIKSRQAYVLDLSGEIGTAALYAPTLISFDINIIGKSSHAGFEPENGANAIQAASNAIVKIRQGRVDNASTLNIGLISGGTATNIVSDNCNVKGELRSLNHDKAIELLDNLKESFTTSAEQIGCKCEINYTIDLFAYEINEESNVVRRYDTACEAMGIKPCHISTFGGSDNNNLVRNGIDGIVIACGMNNCHTCDEYCDINDLVKNTKIVTYLMCN
jgi:tripeptide aminopeptidase